MRPDPSTIPYGFCHCGCGNKTNISKITELRIGRIKGRPSRFLSGHGAIRSGPSYAIENRGYATPCWTWLGATNRTGYGWMTVDSKNTEAHRAYYRKFVGPIPPGLDLDHLCRNRNCVNPEHLEPVTRRENIRRGAITKLTVENVVDVRALLRDGHSHKAIADIFGVTKNTISSIHQGITWRDVVG